ncbi:MAG TPA: pyridoxal phosphate-dependent aminotransferase [Thiolinea sp.]|nr:pyridoxal phosphate-dependent aminotransferase [Thiolinea sp.]
MHYPASKLPHIGTTIFTVMSRMANEYGAINLSQGFPDFNGPQALLERVGHHIARGANQYPPMTGVPPLLQAIAAKVERHYGRSLNPETEITVTSGATEALFDAISSVVFPGDEVILFDPAYDSYVPAIAMNGGKPVSIQLSPPLFRMDWARVGNAITPRTRLIILNSPHNPTGAVLDADDIEQLIRLVAGTDILLLADDVYEHILFDGRQHHSFVSHDALFERSFVVSSFGKTYHTTGWKVGYCVAPAALSAEFRKIHQYVTFTTPTPLQLALADYMQQDPQHCFDLPGFYQQKRDRFCEAMQASRFRFTPSAGTYFQLMDYSAISDLPDVAFCEHLTKTVGVAAIPVSVFCQKPPAMQLVRFCFAKSDQTLLQAAEKLCAI